MGLHILQLGVKNHDAYKFKYRYFISIPHIASFDAVRFSTSITLSSKTFQYRLKIFFDNDDYYIN